MRTQFEYRPESHGLFLATGHDYFNARPFGDPPDEELMRETWEAHRDELLAEAGSGKRPWAWWQFVASEPRRRIGGVGTPITHPETGERYSKGKPVAFGGDYDTANPPRYETEGEYLARLGLLMPGERELLEEKN